jgi:hypothetical protein
MFSKRVSKYCTISIVYVYILDVWFKLNKFKTKNVHLFSAFYGFFFFNFETVCTLYRIK